MSVAMSSGSAEVLSAVPASPEASGSAISWAAVIGGACVASAMSLLLLALGSALGFTAISPFSGSGASSGAFTIMAAIWLIVVQWVASFFGGYLTGRLRTKWVGLHTHEVFFRDTAHGFLSWAVASIVVVVMAAAATSSLIGGGVHAAATVASGAMQGAASGASNTSDYYIDLLFRSDRPATDGRADTRAEGARILAMGLHDGSLSDADKAYLSQLVANRTGISQADAQTRIDEVRAREKTAEAKVAQTAEVARKAAASFSFFMFFSMAIGAFIACVAAAIGGRQRDEY